MAPPDPGDSSQQASRDCAALREQMVERQVAGRGVRDARVLAAMRKVPREAFLPARMRDVAYHDAPVPLSDEQTMSQPYIVGLMTEALRLHGGENVLEIGAGSGYAAAVLAEIAGRVTTIERIAALAERAAAKLAELGYRHVHVHPGDGSRGWPDQAPYDAIVVAAGGPQVPDSLKRQLAIGGRLVMPIGADQSNQRLVRVTRTREADYQTEPLRHVRFVPLLGAEGWAVPEPKPPGRGRSGQQ
jgi:protein-L-isoaspartate(D-aspartate) O-methyltransferase